MHCSGLDKIQPISENNTHEEAHRELDAVVAVEMDFGQQIAQRNTQERAGCQNQHITDYRFLPMSQKTNPPKSQQSHHRTEHGESDIDCDTSAEAMTGGLQQTDNGKRVERLVQKNRKKHPESRQTGFVPMYFTNPDAGTQGDALGHRMQSQPQADTDQPALGIGMLMGMLVGVFVGVFVVEITCLVAKFVLVKMEDTQQQHHQDDAEHHQSHGLFNGVWTGNHHQTVRQEMIQRDAEDETRDKTHHHLDARMRQRNNCRQISTEQRRGEDSEGVSQQKYEKI